MPLAYRDDMVGAFATDRSDQPFGEAVLPRRARRNGFVTDAHGPQSTCNGGTVGLVPIADQVARSLIPRKCLSNLACDPFRRRVRCDIDPDQVSAVQADDDEGIEQIEANGRDNEQIHGSNVRRVVPQKGVPSLTWWSASLDHVLRNARLRDLKSELEQFAMNARRTPQWVIQAHLSDQCALVCVNLRPASQGSGFPAPVPPEAGTMPTHNGFGPDDRDRLQDRWKPSIQLDEEPAIGICEFEATLHLPPQHGQLMPKRRVLRLKPALRLERQDEQRKNEA